MSAGGVRFRYAGAPASQSHPSTFVDDMTPNVTERPTRLDVAALLAQLEDGVPNHDAPLNYEQARALLHEVVRLQTAVAQRDLRITHLMGILS